MWVAYDFVAHWDVRTTFVSYHMKFPGVRYQNFENCSTPQNSLVEPPLGHKFGTFKKMSEKISQKLFGSKPSFF